MTRLGRWLDEKRLAHHPILPMPPSPGRTTRFHQGQVVYFFLSVHVACGPVDGVASFPRLPFVSLGIQVSSRHLLLKFEDLERLALTTYEEV